MAECTVSSATTGEVLAVIHEDEFQTMVDGDAGDDQQAAHVVTLKQLLVERIGFSRFRQVILRGAEKLEDDVKISLPLEVQLLILSLHHPDAGDAEAFLTACRNGDMKKLLEMLKWPMDPNTVRHGRFSALHVAASSKSKDCVLLLLEAKAEPTATEYVNGLTPLHVAIQYGAVKVVRCLLENHAEVDAKSKGGWTPLMLACSRGDLVDQQIEDVIQHLISARADINQTNPVNEWTPLHYAADKDRVQLVRFLLKSNADINKLTNKDSTAMMLATKMGQKRVMPVLRTAAFQQFVQNQLQR